MNQKLIEIHYDQETEGLFETDKYKRTDLSSARHSLNGYQKGHCFYCYCSFAETLNAGQAIEVDHFFPHMLKRHMPDLNFDGVWNLVLACQDCNRGSYGKSAYIPSLKLLERLHRRNSFLIISHHPLRETLLRQTGKNEKDRISFFQNVYDRSKELVTINWEPRFQHEEKF